MSKRNPIEWAFLPFKRYFDFIGRSPRAEYWWFMLACMIVIVALAAIAGGFPFPLANIALVGFVVLAIIPFYSVTVRRLHDFGWSGAWVLVPVILGGILPAIVTRIRPTAFAPELVDLYKIIVYLPFFLLLVRRGTAGENRFGPDPLEPDDGAEEGSPIDG